MQVLVERRLVRGRPDLVQALGEVPRLGHQVLGTRSLAVALVAVTEQALLLVDRLAGLGVALGEGGHGRGGDEGQCDGEPPHQWLVSHRRGCCPVASYRYMMTCQICSSVSRSSQAGMTEFHGVDSLGRPGPPLAMRQNR